MLIKKQLVFFLSRRLVLVFSIQFGKRQVFSCVKLPQSTALQNCTVLCVSPRNFALYQSSEEEECPGGPVV